jgi:diaminohydroxyphosphoribosylaminopyrimidine deaminase / 5-amino-6-(5-phosphoribosylamino)uracil reductase
MLRALELAERGWGRVAPNPLVGALVVSGDAVVGEGYHTEYGRPHAEVEALRQAGEAARGSTLYVTLEPCAHSGKTPPCTEAIVAAGVGRVVYGATDPNPKAAGGADVLRRAGIEVIGSVEADAAMELDPPFFFAHSPQGAERPWIALKLALTLDARIADASGRSAWITGEDARAYVHHLRAGFDAIAIGIGTALADDPRLTVRGGLAPRKPPVRIVFDRVLRLPPDGYLAGTAREWPCWVVCSPDAPTEARRRLEEAGVRTIPAASLPSALRALREAGVRSLFNEGGAGLASAFLHAQVVERMYLFYAALLLGQEAPGAFTSVASLPIEAAHRWRHLETRTFGSDTLITLAR